MVLHILYIFVSARARASECQRILYIYKRGGAEEHGKKWGIKKDKKNKKKRRGAQKKRVTHTHLHT